MRVQSVYLSYYVGSFSRSEAYLTDFCILECHSRNMLDERLANRLRMKF